MKYPGGLKVPPRLRKPTPCFFTPPQPSEPSQGPTRSLNHRTIEQNKLACTEEAVGRRRAFLSPREQQSTPYSRGEEICIVQGGEANMQDIGYIRHKPPRRKGPTEKYCRLKKASEALALRSSRFRTFHLMNLKRGLLTAELFPHLHELPESL